MPTNRPKPKWGHRSKGLLEDCGKQHYDDEQVYRLATMLGENVHKARLDTLKAGLDIAANQYFETRSMFEDAPTHAESKAALRVLQKHAQSLLEGLHMLDDKSWNIILAPEIAASHKLLSEGKVLTSLGYEIEGEKAADGSISYEMLEPDDFVGAAQFIECHLSHALENFPKMTPGKKRLLSLGGWLRHIKAIWNENSGRDFTLNFHKGLVVSDAAVFCKEAISIIDPSVTDANLISAMRDQFKDK